MNRRKPTAMSGTSEKKRSWFFAFAAALILVGGLALALIIGGSEKSFPPLPMGAYFGTISGVSSDNSGSSTLYVERIANTNALLVVVFAEGWKPQVVPMERMFEGVENPDTTLTEDVVLAPIVISHAGSQYQLTGAKTFDGFRGEVATQGGAGKWFIKPARADVLNQNASVLKEGMPDLQEWLVVRTQYVEAQQVREALHDQLAALRTKYERLKSFVEDKDNLRRRARERRDALKAQLEAMRSSRQSSVNEVKRLVSELDLLKRITKRGKAVDLARRLTAREEKWYRANWEAAEDASGIEEALSANSNINLGQLEAQYKKARSRRSLLVEAEAEKRRIAELEERLRRSDDTSAETSERPGTREPGEQKSIWNRLWGRIK